MGLNVVKIVSKTHTHTLLFFAVDTKSLPIDGYLFKPFSYGVESKIMDIFSLRFLLLYHNPNLTENILVTFAYQ